MTFPLHFPLHKLCTKHENKHYKQTKRYLLNLFRNNSEIVPEAAGPSGGVADLACAVDADDGACAMGRGANLWTARFKVYASILIPFKKFARPFGSGFPSARYLRAVSHALTRAIFTRLFSLFAFSAFCRTVSASSAPIADSQLIRFQRPRSNCMSWTITV